MQYKHFIGIDVSKQKLDIAVFDGSAFIVNTVIENNEKAVGKFIKELRGQKDFSVKGSLFCLEHTGLYTNPALAALGKCEAPIWLESGAQIKASNGLQRGKSDRIDAMRIARYAFLKRDEVKIWQPPREVVKRLKDLLASRDRLITVRTQLKTPLEEQSAFVTKKITKQNAGLFKSTLTAIAKNIEEVEKAILKIIEGDENLSKLYKQVVSIDNVGFVTAAHCIVYTNEFKNITEGKKFASFCGVVPYEHSSGSSIKGKNRVSHMANKKMKTLLHMAAVSAIRSNGELKDYYIRKIAEGKHIMSILNAIRNKIILRIFAAVREDRLFIKNYKHVLIQP